MAEAKSMTAVRRDSYTMLRETMRWRVALVLASLVGGLMFAIALMNRSLGYGGGEVLAWISSAVGVACIAALLLAPRHLGGTIFFAAVTVLLLVVPAYGIWQDRPMPHWCYVFPCVLIFLLRAGPALVAMIAYGIYAGAAMATQLAPIEVVRFACGYGMLVCFMYTYALLEQRAAAMLRYHSDHDALSNCLNRRTLNEALDQLANGRTGAALCTFLLIDIDNFKAINDQHGHLVGDRIITQVAAELGRELAPGVPLFRYGGEEFAVMLLHADVETGAALAERLRAAVAKHDFSGVAVTVSIGVAEWRAAHGTVPNAIDAADRALYEAKRSGRNRVVAGSREARAA